MYIRSTYNLVVFSYKLKYSASKDLAKLIKLLIFEIFRYLRIGWTLSFQNTIALYRFLAILKRFIVYSKVSNIVLDNCSNFAFNYKWCNCSQYSKSLPFSNFLEILQTYNLALQNDKINFCPICHSVIFVMKSVRVGNHCLFYSQPGNALKSITWFFYDYKLTISIVLFLSY